MANVVSQLANNAVNTLASAITDAQLTLTVGDAKAFPSTGDFRILLGSETMLVTAVAVETFTVTRGIEGTVASAHSAGAIVKAVTTEGVLVDFDREHLVYGSASPRLAITDPATEGRAVVSDFTWVNQSTATAVDKGGKILITVPLTASGDNFRGLFITPPSAPYAVIGAFAFHSERGGTGVAAPLPQAEILFRESGTGKLFTIAALPRSDAATGRWNVRVKTMTDETNFLADKLHVGWNYGDGPVWFKIEDDNVDLKFFTGPNGIDWIELYSETRTTHMAAGPNQVGFGVNLEGTNNHAAFMELLHFGLEG